ncbi:alpha/beta hydrolase [Paenibacillus sp. FSL K6-0276]|uniref:alpha/beta hydrolase n=1 Tax=Paenibacillus sp. FSL K6-0276 TaxID=2921450 RepID=UPI0030EEAA33
MTQTEVIKTGNGKKKHKVRNLLLKIFGAIVIAIVLFLAVVYTFNVISSKSDQGKIHHYGQLVPVDGKNMNVLIQGTGEETIVLLPGFGTGAPALDFKPLIDELSPYYKVVAVEPFGYGLSDETKKERTTENIVSEIHEAVQGLNIDQYILMGHSIAGIYGLEYAKKYPNEVSAFVGIDSSVPEQGGMDVKFPIKKLKLLKDSGILRLGLQLSGDPYDGLPFDDETKKQMKLISLKNMNNSTTLNEMEHIYPNFVAARGLKFDKNLPLIFFIQANNEGVKDWIPLHEEQVKDSVHGKVMTFEGGHYLHHSRSKEIVENLRAFMGEIK